MGLEQYNKKNNDLKSDFIRKMLLKTVGKDPDLFTYFVSIQEAKELLGNEHGDTCKLNKIRNLRKLAEG